MEDIQTAETLNLPTPEFENINVVVKPSEIQQEMVKALGERAEKIRSGAVDATEDNMLKITNEGRKLALDQRLMNPLLPDSESSKVNSCSENIYRIWNENSYKKSTQLVFCDLSTPKDLKGYEKEEFMNQKYSLQDRIIKYFPEEIARLNNKIGAMEEDTIKLQEYTKPNADGFSPMKINLVILLI